MKTAWTSLALVLLCAAGPSTLWAAETVEGEFQAAEKMVQAAAMMSFRPDRSAKP